MVFASYRSCCSSRRCATHHLSTPPDHRRYGVDHCPILTVKTRIADFQRADRTTSASCKAISMSEIANSPALRKMIQVIGADCGAVGECEFGCRTYNIQTHSLHYRQLLFHHGTPDQVGHPDAAHTSAAGRAHLGHSTCVHDFQIGMLERHALDADRGRTEAAQRTDHVFERNLLRQQKGQFSRVVPHAPTKG
jgi:hypothetical protein